MSTRFRPGIESLLGANARWIDGHRVGLLTHAAAVNAAGVSSAQLLARDPRCRLVALFGPEHGLFGTAGAGQHVRRRKHPALGIPIHSLYGKHRKPTRAMLNGIDTIVCDLQDLSVRCYTYVATLRLVMEAASEHGCRVVVADRPTPFANTVDGPVTVPSCESFVSLVATPMVYGMTPGEAALWIERFLGLELDLKIARMRGYGRETHPMRGWPPWVPPSPGIVSPESARCYPATVLAEAFSIIDYGRMTQLPFQVFSVPGTPMSGVCERLAAAGLRGVRFATVHYAPSPRAKGSRIVEGVRLTVTDPRLFLPFAAAIHIVAAVQACCGRNRLWKHPGTRPDFFDKLCGTPAVRLALLSGEAPGSIVRRWTRETAAFRTARKRCLLYGRDRNSAKATRTRI